MDRNDIRRGARQGRWTLVVKGVYGVGPEPPSPLDIARATAMVTLGIAADAFAGVLLGFDNVALPATPTVLVAARASNDRPGVRRVRELPRWIEVAQVRCTDGATTLWALARRLGDDEWEQALESALRLGHVTTGDIAAMSARPERQAARVRRVVATRGGLDVAPTDSLLETLMVQLVRKDPQLPPPERQVKIYSDDGVLIARVDLAWPSLGIFIELDGQQHEGQPVYDAARQTAVTAATGWLVARFTWHQVTRTPAVVRRQLLTLIAQARQRAVSA